MAELEFSTIHNDEQDLAAIRGVLQAFEKDSHIHVKLTPMPRGNAWNELMTIASTGKGPDISHVGSTWVSSLVGMNAVRAFREKEVTGWGGGEVFIPSAWQDAHVLGDETVWSAPWNSFFFVIFYRRDLLANAGIEEASAFGSVEALSRTIAALQKAPVEISWITPYGAPPFDGLLHQAASWVWGAGGDFVDAEGKRIVLASPQGIAGLTGWLDSLRAVPDEWRMLNDNQCVALIEAGRAAAIVSHIRTASPLVARLVNDQKMQQIGFAPISDSPWCAGDNLIIWQHTQGYPAREKAAVELVHFLMQPEQQAALGRAAHIMPSRRDALLALFPETSPLHGVTNQSSQAGKAYSSMKLWRRVEFQLAQAIGGMVQDIHQKGAPASESIVRKHLEPTVERLNLMLGN